MILVIRTVVALVVWILIGAFVGGYLAYYVDPVWAWWMQVLALALPAIVAALIPATVLAFLLHRRGLALTCLAALLLFGIRHAPFGLVHGTRSVGEDTIRFLTYNAHGAKGFEDGDRAGVLPLAAKTSPDVICFQEFAAVPGSRPRGSVLDSLAVDGYQMAAALPDGKRRASQRPILSRYPVRAVQTHSLSPRAESYVVHATLEAPGGTFDVYNVHLAGLSALRPWRGGNLLDPRDWILFFRSSSSSYVLRSRESLELRALLEKRERPAIVCGDFNATSNQWTYRHGAAGMKDAFREAGKGWGKTYHARLPLVRIDYILASDEWKVIGADVLRGADSDHRAVVADLDLEAE